MSISSSLTLDDDVVLRHHSRTATKYELSSWVIAKSSTKDSRRLRARGELAVGLPQRADQHKVAR